MTFFKIQDGRRRKTDIYYKWNNFRTVYRIRTKSDFQHLLHTRKCLQSQNPEIPSARWPPVAILNFTKTLIYFRTVRLILTKFDMELHRDTAQTLEWSKMSIFQNPKTKTQIESADVFLVSCHFQHYAVCSPCKNYISRLHTRMFYIKCSVNK